MRLINKNYRSVPPNLQYIISPKIVRKFPAASSAIVLIACPDCSAACIYEYSYHWID